jgi:Caspase domain
MIPRTHIFTIAIESYRDEKIPPIAFAEQDATVFAGAWIEHGVASLDCCSLYGEQAHLANISQSLKKFLRRVHAGDRVILFYVGHGLSMGQTSFLTMFDSRRHSIEKTSLSLRDLLDELGRSKATGFCLFLDANHEVDWVDETLFEKPSHFAAKELNEFLESEGRVAFVSCRAGEKSYSSPQLKHGIWTKCVLDAIVAGTHQERENSTGVTAASLQFSIMQQIPRELRMTFSATRKQTPWMIAKKPDQFILIGGQQYLSENQNDSQGASIIIKDSSLVGEVRGRVRDLSGFVKPKIALASHNSWEQSFVQKAGEGEVAMRATEIVDKLRNHFRFKRKDLDFTNLGSIASIKVPDFDVNISLAQDPEVADKYVMRTEVASFKRPEVIDDPNFIDVFAEYCNKVVIDLGKEIDLASKIDEIEEIDALVDHLKYDPDCTEFTLRIPTTRIIMHATRNQIVFSLDGPSDLKLLLESSLKAISQLASTSLFIGLPNTTSA